MSQVTTEYSSPFEEFQAKAWPFLYKAGLVVEQICGGVPATENAAEGWIRAKLKDTRSDAEVKLLVEQTKQEIRETNLVAGRLPVEELAEEARVAGKTMSEEELLDAAVEKTAKSMAGLNQFKRTPDEGYLYIEGRQVKAALKEAVAVAANAGKITTKGWGNPDNAAYKKQLKGWFPEHVFVPETQLWLYKNNEPVKEPDGILQKFVHTHRGDAIAYEEYVLGAEVYFSVKTDVELTEEQWAMIWLTGQDQGLGASRSQGFGVYKMFEWAQVKR